MSTDLENLLNNKVMKKAVLSLSGGMDSSSLLLHLLANGYEVTTLGFDYGQKHKVELERATDLVKYLNTNRLTHTDHVPGGFIQAFPVIKHQIIKLDGLSQLLNSALVEGGQDVPEGHYEQDNMKETVVPNRNKIFSSLIQAVALSIATKNSDDDCTIGQPVEIAMGIHAGDHAIYPDCRQEFRDADFEAFKIGNWDSDLVTVTTPYLHENKFTILEDGQRSCDILGLDFNEVYKSTNTSYKPIRITTEHKWFQTDDEGEVYGDEQTTILEKWYSDYKSAASVERIEAFIKLGRPDPVAYADETGPVTWEVAKAHVEEVLAQHSK
jgi:7-cyano-7-deazaguanine synthase